MWFHKYHIHWFCDYLSSKHKKQNIEINSGWIMAWVKLIAYRYYIKTNKMRMNIIHGVICKYLLTYNYVV